MKPNNLIGMRFNRLLVIADGGRCAKQNILWRCLCDCGGTAKALAYDLRAGKVKSCGCLVREGCHRTHGQGGAGSRRNPTYSIWAAMMQRCSNPNDKNWMSYGGRGITVCNAWRVFEAFYADMGNKPVGLTLDRRNNNEGYNKRNCRWVPTKTQNRNKRSNVWVDIEGTSKVLQDWCDTLNISRQGVYYWTKKGLSYAEAITRVSRKK